MPSRWLSAAILAFWLAATGWLFWRDLWPAWKPGEPPPYTIDLVEEVKRDITAKTNWVVLRQHGKQAEAHKVFDASTWVEHHPREDEFSLHCELAARGARRTEPYVIGEIFRVDSLGSEYRVGRDGRLRSLQSRVSVTAQSSDPSGGEWSSPLRLLLRNRPRGGTRQADAGHLWVRLSGEVRVGRFSPRCEAGVYDGKKDKPGEPLVRLELPAAEVSANGSLLMPLHPVNRIHGLRPGQTWRQPLVDPIRDAFRLSGDVRYVLARVLPAPQILEWDEGTRAACLVIEYESEGETVGRTWVEQDSERVQQQEAYLDGDHWIMRRETPVRGSGRLF